MSSTRAPRISNSICSPRMTGTSSTTPSPPTWRSPCPPCMTSSAAAALRRRPSPNSGRIRARGRPHEALRSQQRLAAAQRARVQPRPQLPARYRRRPPPSLPQAHLHVRPAEHAHPALHARRPRRSAGAHRRAPRASPHLQPGHHGPLHETGATPCRLIYFRIGAKCLLVPSSSLTIGSSDLLTIPSAPSPEIWLLDGRRITPTRSRPPFVRGLEHSRGPRSRQGSSHERHDEPTTCCVLSRVLPWSALFCLRRL